MDESFSFLRLPGSVLRIVLARLSRRSRPQPRRNASAHDRRLDSALSRLYAQRHAVAQVAESSRTHPLSPHARLVRVFLRELALPHLSWPRSVFRSPRHVEGRLQAALHYRRLSRIHSADSSRSLPPPDGFAGLAAAAGKCCTASSTSRRLPESFTTTGWSNPTSASRCSTLFSWASCCSGVLWTGSSGVAPRPLPARSRSKSPRHLP